MLSSCIGQDGAVIQDGGNLHSLIHVGFGKIIMSREKTVYDNENRFCDQ